MIVIADSGSTKTSWALISNNHVLNIDSEGYNPYHMNTDYIQKTIIQNFEQFGINDEVLQVFFYGAGCSPDRKDIVEAALKACFSNAEIIVEGDLLAAARCLLRDKSGFAAILGTGTNSCFYNGKEIVEVIDSLGFLAGNEGSGAYLGKLILQAYVRGFMPPHLNLLFQSTFNITSSQLISELYATKSPNKFAAQFSTFAGQNINDDFIIDLVKSSFRNFFTGIIIHYKNYRGMEISFVGSVAFVFMPILVAVAAEFDMNVGKVVKSPIKELVAYHSLNPPKYN